MKVTVYNCREFDEKELFLKYEKEWRKHTGIEAMRGSC